MVAVERIFSQHLRIFSLTIIYIVHQCSPSLIPRYSKISQASHVLCGLDDLMTMTQICPDLSRSQICRLSVTARVSAVSTQLCRKPSAWSEVSVSTWLAHITPCHTPTITVEVCLMGVSYAVASKTVRTFSLSGAVGGKQITNAIRPRSALKQSWSRLVNTWQIAAGARSDSKSVRHIRHPGPSHVVWYYMISMIHIDTSMILSQSRSTSKFHVLLNLSPKLHSVRQWIDKTLLQNVYQITNASGHSHRAPNLYNHVQTIADQDHQEPSSSISNNNNKKTMCKPFIKNYCSHWKPLLAFQKHPKTISAGPGCQSPEVLLARPWATLTNHGDIMVRRSRRSGMTSWINLNPSI